MRQNTRPDYHFLYLPANLGPEWLFDAARVYWEFFQPVVLSDFAFLAFVPEDASVVVTVLSRRDQIADLGVQLAQASPNAQLDAVVFDMFDEMQVALDARAAQNQPFGEPLLPTATPTDARLNPTPGALIGPTRAPAGFITQTPTPTTTPTQPPPPQSDDTNADAPPPITPTPGSLIGE